MRSVFRILTAIGRTSIQPAINRVPQRLRILSDLPSPTARLALTASSVTTHGHVRCIHAVRTLLRKKKKTDGRIEGKRVGPKRQICGKRHRKKDCCIENPRVCLNDLHCIQEEECCPPEKKDKGLQQDIWRRQ